MSYRLPYSKLMSGLTNMITAVMLNHFFMPRTMFLVEMHFWVCSLSTVSNGKLCKDSKYIK